MEYHYVSPTPIFEVKGFGKMTLIALGSDKHGSYPIFEAKERYGRVEESVWYRFDASYGAWFKHPQPKLSKVVTNESRKDVSVWIVPECPIPMGLLVAMIRILCLGDGKPKHLSSVLKHYGAGFASSCHFISIFEGGWMMESSNEEGRKVKWSGASIFTLVREWSSRR